MNSQHILASKIAEIKESFYELIDHSYLARYVKDPTVDEDKILFFYTITDHLPQKKQEDQILAALLVEAAFEVHESISLQNLDCDQKKKSRQLTVLAGDFFSSLYYHTLTKGKHFSVLNVFTASIQQMNEHKMTLHQSEVLSEEALVEGITGAETGLIRNMAEFYGKEWIGTVAEIFFVYKRISEEVNKDSSVVLSAVASAINRYVTGGAESQPKNWPSIETKRWAAEKKEQFQGELKSFLSSHPLPAPMGNRIQEVISKGSYNQDNAVEEG
ncbi:heptaprenyl diphosphate synthase component 1 [Thalassobacillus sp. C254]|uniref:heptaprenyl diphosphate synthase component 1 n=1 Tax=Thalassobacillus sp. C254 TaxID=1225341 RepID=UPI0006D26540|nr:heptaprenyl diphosphate synthase component 1 [Thalassobacillus sp. C254]